MVKLTENKNPEVRRHFNQALMSLSQRKQTSALLNLNMVLSLKPNHFLARVFRGRIYIKEGQYRLASEDYLEANRISQFRFIHYDLYREYFKSVNNEFGEEDGKILEKCDDVFKAMNFISCVKDLKPEASREFQKYQYFTEPDDALDQNLTLTAEEKEKFEALGPITQQEIEETDWDSLLGDFNS